MAKHRAHAHSYSRVAIAAGSLVALVLILVVTTAPHKGAPASPAVPQATVTVALAAQPAPVDDAALPPAEDPPVQVMLPRMQTQRLYLVQPGDTLTKISQTFALPGWQLLYAANRPVIGANPNLIYPAQTLTIP